ncbi:hypothetical protein BOX15_Mlig012222g1, partial [Macrostomum lignano]
QLVDDYCACSMRSLDARVAFDNSGYRLDSCAFRVLANRCCSLRLLRFHSQHSWLVDQLLVPVIHSNVHLQAVYLDQAHWLTDSSVQALASACPQLTHLSLRDCHWLSSSGLEIIGSAWPDLSTLDLTCCWQIDDPGLSALLTGCQRLEQLSVAKCYGLTDESLLNLRSNKCLMELDMTGCWRITDSLLEQLTEFCRSLKQLKIRECSRVSLAAIDRLQKKRIVTDLKPPAAYRLFAAVDHNGYPMPQLNVQI